MNDVIKKLQNKLIVSCQAYEDSPLYGVDYMRQMALCAEKGGASGIRACWADNVREIRKVTKLPIIGINKVIHDGFNPVLDVCITPSFEAAAEIIEAGADIIALDGTPRGRSFDDVNRIIEKIRKYYPQVLVMADISTTEEGIQAEAMGVDIVSTTLAGYTEYSRTHYVSDAPDYNIVRELKATIKKPVNAEGRIWEVGQFKKIWDAGADMVTIGTAITRPELITARFVQAIPK